MTNSVQPPGSEGEPSPPSSVTFRLKGMVIVRLLAEAVGLVVLFVLPGLLLVHGDFFRLAITTRIAACLVSVVAAIVFPFYLSIAYKVTVDGEGISTFSLVASQHAEWELISALKLKSSWGWRRYEITSSGGNLTFLTWMNDLPHLVAIVRERLPFRGFGGPAPGGVREFRQEFVSLAVQWLKTLVSLVFLFVFWGFALSLQHPVKHVGAAKSDPADFVIVLIVCLTITAVVVLRLLVVANMPRLVRVSPDGIFLQSFLYKFDLPWPAIRAVCAPWFFLPDGLLLKTRKGLFLVGDQLDSFDELQEELALRVPVKPLPPKKAEIAKKKLR